MAAAKRKDVLLLQQSIERTVRLLTGLGIPVYQRGAQAYVKWKEIESEPEFVNIPVITDNASSTFIDAIHGFIDHEVAHILYTDPSYVKLGMTYHQGTEDCYIEAMSVIEFPGAVKNLHKTRLLVISEWIDPGWQKCKSESLMDRWNQLGIAAFRAWAGQPEFIEYMDDKWEFIQDVVDALHVSIPKFKSLRSTKDAYELAKEIKDTLFVEPPPPPPPPPEKPEDSNDSDDIDEDKDGTEDGDSSGGEDEDGDEDEEDGDKEEGEDEDGDEDEEDGDKEEGEDSDADEEEGDGDKEEGEDSDADEEEGAGEDEQEGEEDGPTGDSSDGNEESDDEESNDEDSEGGSGSGSDSNSDESESDDEGERDESGDDSEATSDDSEDTSDTGDRSDDNESGGKPEDSEAGEPISPSDDKPKEAVVAIFKDEEEPEEDADDMLAKLLEAMAVEEHLNTEYVPYTRVWDKIEKVEFNDTVHLRDKMRSMQDEVDDVSGSLRRHLARMFESMNRDRWEGGKKKGKLNANNLARLKTNNPRVFKTKEITRTKKTAVTLLVDCSGSMSGAEIHNAMLTAWAFAETLEKLGINFEVLGFTTAKSSSDESRRDFVKGRQEYGDQYVRYEAIYMPIFKSFSESMTTKAKLGMTHYTNGGAMVQNVDGESVKYAGDRLLRQPEENKVLIVLSDGMPAASTVNSYVLKEHLTKTVNDLDKLGVTTVGIGINSEAVREFYKKSVVIKNISELPGAAITQLGRLVLAR